MHCKMNKFKHEKPCMLAQSREQKHMM